MTQDEEILHAGRVRRWHTIAGLNQSVAEHSWGVAVLLLLHDPHVTVNALREALIHDVHERWLGDLPTMAKDRRIVAIEAETEEYARRHFGFPVDSLSDREKAQIKYFDKLEALHFIQAATDPARLDAVEESLWNAAVETGAAAGINAHHDLNTKQQSIDLDDKFGGR